MNINLFSKACVLVFIAAVKKHNDQSNSYKWNILLWQLAHNSQHQSIMAGTLWDADRIGAEVIAECPPSLEESQKCCHMLTLLPWMMCYLVSVISVSKIMCNRKDSGWGFFRSRFPWRSLSVSLWTRSVLKHHSFCSKK